MQSFKKLDVWQKAHKLAVHAYELPACDFNSLEYCGRTRSWL